MYHIDETVQKTKWNGFHKTEDSDAVLQFLMQLFAFVQICSVSLRQCHTLPH